MGRLRSIATLVLSLTVLVSETSAQDGGVWTIVGTLSGSLWNISTDNEQPQTIYVGAELGGAYHASVEGPLGLVVGLQSGAINSVVVSPINPHVILAGGLGLHRSTDDGSSWSTVSIGDPIVRDLEFDPSDGDILYAGTTNGPGSAGSVYRSVDGGVTWVGAAFDDWIEVVAVDPSDSRVVFAGSLRSGLYKSTDSGDTWLAVGGLTDAWIRDIEIDPSNPQVMYVGVFSINFQSASGGVFKSTDGGATFDRSSGLTTTDIGAVLVDPSQPQTVYAGGQNGGVSRSRDGGETWEAFDDGWAGPYVSALEMMQTAPPTLLAVTAFQSGYAGFPNGGGVFSRTLSNPDGPPLMRSLSDREAPVGDQLQIYLSAADPTGDDLSFTTSGAPSGSTLSGNLFSWTPNSDNVGSHSITFTVSDGNGGTDSEVVQITVAESSSSNSGPILASVGSKSVVAGSSLSIILSASDVDGDALSYSVSGNPAGSSLSGTTFSWTPESGDVGTHNVTFSVSDGNGGSDSEVVQITVEGVQNSNPVLASIGPQSVKTDGSTLTITLSATDSDGDVLTYTVSGNQSGSALSGSEFSYTPLALDTGTVPVTFTVSDGNGGSDSEVVQITVSVGNLAPVPQAINAVTSEDQATEIQLSATDPDGDAVYFLLSTQPSHGSASLSGDVLTYTPNPDYAGLDTVGYAATDSSLTSEIEFIVIDVTQVNDAPSLPSQVTEVNEDETLLLVLSVFDPDGDETSLRLVVAPDHGSVELGDNQIEYTPASEYSGPDSLQLAVSDGQIESSAWISINVLSVNDPPVFHAVTTEFAIEELDTLRIVLETSDPEEKVLGLRVVTAPVGLEMEFGIVTWVPDATQAGEYEIVFEVLDLKGGSSTITFSVEVANVNQPPTIEVESRLVFHEGESGGYVVKVNDVDDDPVTLNFEADNEGISIQDSVITWTPDFEAAGEWQATLTAGDGLAETIVQLRLVVVNVNRPPTADPVVPQSIDVGDTLRVEVVAEDPDGDLVVFELVESYAGLSMEENILTWVPVLDQRGDRELAVLLSDGEGGESTLVVVVSIKGKIPLAQFTADTQIGLAPLTVQFTDISVGRIDNWWWAFGDGGIGFEQHPTHVYSQPGVYSVDLRASNDDGVAYDTLEVTALEATIYIGSAPELAGPTPTLEVAANHYQSESVSIRASFTLDGVEWRPATVDPTRVEGSANVVWRFTEDVMERGEYDVRIAFQPEVELGLSDTVAFHVSTVGPSIVEVTGDYGGLEMRVLFDREVVIGDGTQFELEGLDVEEVIQEAPDVIRLRLSTPLPEGELTLTAREVLDELDGSGGGRFSFVPMNSPPSVRIAEVEQAEAGEWNFSVAIEDVQSNSVQLSVEYQIGNDWISIDLGGPFEPGEHSLTWIPTGDVLGYQGDLLVRMWGTDIEMGEVVSIEVVVDLNDAPLLSSLTIPEPLSRLVEVEFEGSDSEADSIHVVFEYAVGSEWFQVDPDDISVNRQGDGFSGVISWDTFAEFGYGEFPSVAIQLSAADLDTTFLDTVVTIRNLAGDYDGDGQISAPDLAVFTSHWLDESADADLGPATGDLPLLIPEGDGLLNFEDLLVVAQMWNWSIGIIPQGVVGKSTGNENLAFTELTTQEGRLRVVVDPYGALSADVTIRLHGEDVEVVSPQSFVMKRRSEGLLEVFVGALDGAPSPFSVTIEDPTTVHGVTRIWNTDGTLRTTESWSYTPPQPQATSLTGSWPNPFNSSTTIGLEVSDESFLTLNVYDVLGRRVRSLLSDMLPAGVHQVVWDGRDDEGLSVGSGIYIVRMVADDVMSLQRVLLLK